MSGMVFEVMQETANVAIIKVIGVGGGGCNAIDNMIEGNVHGVEFICANTDAQSLLRNKSPQKLQLGNNLTRGPGAGANPEVPQRGAGRPRTHRRDAARLQYGVRHRRHGRWHRHRRGARCRRSGLAKWAS